MITTTKGAFIFAIDPGDTESGYVISDINLKPLRYGKVANEKMLDIIYEECQMNSDNGCLTSTIPHISIEMIASYGMAVGKNVFETCVWIGRFYQAIYENCDIKPVFIYRQDEKMNLCHSMKANDSTIRRALIDRFSKHDFRTGKGTKKNPDWFYGVSKDVWQAYAIAVTYYDMYIAKNGYK